MLEVFGEKLKRNFFKIRSFLIAKVSKRLLHLLIKTCRLQITGINLLCETVSKEKCMIMLWHNRLAIAPFIFSKYTPHIRYAAVVSASRDGDILRNIIHSYRNGNTIRVPHSARYQALKNIIEHVKEGKEVVVITPDGPRGPCYELKPGIAVAALETQAQIFALDWEAESYWKFNTWDEFRIPKPFTTIRVTIYPPLCFDKFPQPTLDEARALLAARLNTKAQKRKD